MRNKLTTSLLTLFLFVAAPLLGQEILLNAVDSESITVEQIESAISVVESRQGLDAETRGVVIEYLLDAQVQILSRRAAEEAAATYATSLETAPEETVALRTRLDEESLTPPTAESLGIDERTTLAELEQRLAQETADLTAFESQLVELKAQVEIELGRPAAIRDRIDRLRESREALAEIVNTHQKRRHCEPALMKNH